MRPITKALKFITDLRKVEPNIPIEIAHALFLLADKGPTFHTEIQKTLGLSRAGGYRAVTYLVERDLVTSRPDPNGGGNRAALTDRGELVVQGLLSNFLQT